MVGLEKTTHRSNTSRYPWDLDAEMLDDEEEEFELWLQEALAAGIFSETSRTQKELELGTPSSCIKRRLRNKGEDHLHNCRIVVVDPEIDMQLNHDTYPKCLLILSKGWEH